MKMPTGALSADEPFVPPPGRSARPSPGSRARLGCERVTAAVPTPKPRAKAQALLKRLVIGLFPLPTGAMSVTLLHPRRVDQVLLSQWTDLHGYSDTCATVTVLFYLQKSRVGVTRPGGGTRSGEMRAFRFQRNDRLSRSSRISAPDGRGPP